MENKDLKNVINKWFEMKYQTYDRLENEDSIYLYYDGEEYAEIRIDKKSKYIFYEWELYMEFSGIIPLKYRKFEMVIINWVGDTFGLKGFTPVCESSVVHRSLKIPKINN